MKDKELKLEESMRMSRPLTHWVDHHTYYLNTSIPPK
jgi:hypothetical protein